MREVSQGVQKILIDRREPRRLREALSDIGEETELGVGDYVMFTADDLSVAIERAAIGDLLSKVTDGRLYSQLQGITQFDIPILLVEGVYSPASDGRIRLPSVEFNWKYDSLENLLLDAQLRGIILSRTPSLEATARLIRAYHGYFSKGSAKFQVRKERLFSYNARVTPQLRLVSALPQVNWQLAHRLLDRFGTPLDVFSSEPADLQSVNGVGKAKSEEIYNVLRSSE